MRIASTSLLLLMKEAVSIFETLVNFYHSMRCNIPKDSRLHNTVKSELLFAQDSRVSLLHSSCIP